MQPEMPCALTTKMEAQLNLRQPSPAPKLPLDRPVAAIHRRGHRQAVATHPLVHPQAAAAIHHPVHLQAAAVIHHLDLRLAIAIRHRPNPRRAVHPLSHPLQAMAIVRQLNLLSGQKPINDPQRRT
jgi:hypothetical protein